MGLKYRKDTVFSHILLSKLHAISFLDETIKDSLLETVTAIEKGVGGIENVIEKKIYGLLGGMLPNDFCKFISKSEELLLQIGYREHFIHQFQVYLLGSIVLDRFYRQLLATMEIPIDTPSRRDLDFSWLVASSLHDCCNILQGWRKIERKVYSKLLSIKVEKNGDGYIVSDKLHEEIRELAETICYNYDTQFSVDEIISTIKALADKGDHGILAGLSLVKRGKDYQMNFNHLLSASAVALHSEAFYNSMLTSERETDCRPRFTLKPEEVLKNRMMLNSLSFEKNPISYLLISCDAMQEWGRPSLFRSAKGTRIHYYPNNPRLYFTLFSRDSIGITLEYHKASRESPSNFKKRVVKAKNEFANLEKILNSKVFIFDVEIKTTAEDEKFRLDILSDRLYQLGKKRKKGEGDD